MRIRNEKYLHFFMSPFVAISSYFQQICFETVVVTADIDTHESGHGLADDTAMGMPADQIVVETRVKRQVANQILHARVKAVMARIMAVQEDMRDMMGAEQRRHSRLHFGTNHIDVVGIEFFVAHHDFANAPVLPAVPFVHSLAFPNTH